jgi:GTP pyrophosphokinase
MRSITVDSDEGIFSGSIMIYVNDTQHLENLIAKLKQVKGITDITRFDSENEKINFKSA